MTTRNNNQRHQLHEQLLAVHRAGLAAAATVETAANRIVRRRAIREGDRALEDLLRDLEGLLRYFARRFAHDHHDLEDLMQTARLHAVRALPAWQPNGGATITTWVATFLHSELRSAIRRIRPHHEVLTSFDINALDDLGIVPCVVEQAFEFVESATDAGDRLDRLHSTLDPHDALHLAEMARGDVGAGGSAWARGRVRALVAHPTSGVMPTTATSSPFPRSSTPIDLDADTAWLATNPEPQPNWTVLAPCAGDEQADYFPPRGVPYADSTLECCRTCPVRLDCLAAGSQDSTWPGMWGGHPLRARTAIRKAIRIMKSEVPTK